MALWCFISFMVDMFLIYFLLLKSWNGFWEDVQFSPSLQPSTPQVPCCWDGGTCSEQILCQDFCLLSQWLSKRFEFCLRENVSFHFHIYTFLNSLWYTSTNVSTVGRMDTPRKTWNNYPSSCLLLTFFSFSVPFLSFSVLFPFLLFFGCFIYRLSNTT